MIFRDEGNRRGSGGDFIAGFILGGAVFGAVAYIFAPQVINLYVTLSLILLEP